MKTQRELSFPVSDGVRVRGELYLPRRAPALGVFVHGSGTTRHDEPNEQVARRLRQRGFGKLLVDLLEDYETCDRHNVFDMGLQAQRLIDALRWLRAVEPHCDTLPLGYFGGGVGAGVVLIAAARAPELAGALDIAFRRCASDKEKVCVDSPSHLYREPEAVEAAADHAERWFTRHLLDTARTARSGTSAHHGSAH